ncbi:MAG: fibronectin type III domain-containing protein [Roseiflexaceae bacterium]
MTLSAGAQTTTQTPTITAVGGNQQVALNWTTSSHTTDIVDYQIEYCDESSICNIYDDGISTNTYATVTGLQNGTTYTFNVTPLLRQRSTGTQMTSHPITPRAAFLNGSFEADTAGTVADGTNLTGWEIVGISDYKEVGGPNRINLGVTSLGGCTSVDTVDYQTTKLRGVSDPENDDPTLIHYFTATAGISNTVTSRYGDTIPIGSGANTLMLKIDARAYYNPTAWHVLHGPAAVSDTFSATAGDTITLDWYAKYVFDDFSVLGYLLDTSTCTQTEFLDYTDTQVPGWQTASVTVPASGSNYKLVFVNGTFDLTGGSYSGAEMYIDNITMGAAQTITFTPISDIDQSVTPTTSFTANATSSSGLPVTLTSTTERVCTVSGTTVTLVALGTCNIQASQPGGTVGSTTYAAAPFVTETFYISNGSATLTLTRTFSRTPTNTHTPTYTSTHTPTATPTFTETSTPTTTPTDTSTPSITLTPTDTSTPSITLTPTDTSTPSIIRTATRSKTQSPSSVVASNTPLLASVTARRTSTLTPTATPTSSRNAIKTIANGASFTIGINNRGKLVTWGFNDGGQSSLPAWTSKSTFSQVSTGSNYVIVRTKSGHLFGWGKNDFGQLNIPPIARSKIKKVSANLHHVLAITNSNQVVAWGRNHRGQANVPRALKRALDVSAGHSHSLAITVDRKVFAWGSDSFRQATPPKDLTDVIAISAGFDHSLALRRDGTIACWGNNKHLQCEIPYGATNIVAISAGLQYSLALRDDGKVFAWGRRDIGQIEVPEYRKHIVAVAAGYTHSVLAFNDGSVKAFGVKQHGALTTRTPTRIR